MTSSIEHIRATPGFADRDWPKVMGLPTTSTTCASTEDFRLGKGFTYAVLDPADGDVIGCVYVYPPRVLLGMSARGSGPATPTSTSPCGGR